ncbi:MAG: hypothetical protein JOZ83_10615 [Silvibacterium sp.]|nr:hypothetical protein [Silvibacterium sp.]
MRPRLSWRIWLRIGLFFIAIVLLLVRLVPLHRVKAPAERPIRDLAATSPLNQPGDGVAPADAYEVYSGIYRSASPDPLAFAEGSITDIPQVDGSCLKPSTPQEQQMTDAFVAANRQSRRWEQKFSIGQGYRLLPRAEVGKAMGCLATHGRDADACKEYNGLRYVRFLGVPGFDQTHTHALVSVIKSCGGFCGNGGIFAVERSGDGWQRSPTTDFTRNCSWMY